MKCLKKYSLTITNCRLFFPTLPLEQHITHKPLSTLRTYCPLTPVPNRKIIYVAFQLPKIWERDIVHGPNLYSLKSECHLKLASTVLVINQCYSRIERTKLISNITNPCQFGPSLSLYISSGCFQNLHNNILWALGNSHPFRINPNFTFLMHAMAMCYQDANKKMAICQIHGINRVIRAQMHAPA